MNCAGTAGGAACCSLQSGCDCVCVCVCNVCFMYIGMCVYMCVMYVCM